jgi:hypothetical protein
LAALLEHLVYCFGELLQHPIIEYVRKDFPYLYELLEAFNREDPAEWDENCRYINVAGTFFLVA